MGERGPYGTMNVMAAAGAGGVQVQGPSPQSMAQHGPAETEPRANQAHIQNAASHPGGRQLPMDSRHMHRYPSVRRRMRADQQDSHTRPLVSTNRW